MAQGLKPKMEEALHRLLKDIAIQATANHADELLGRKDFIKLCKGHGDIGLGL
jgi:hypothetical protein